MPIEESCVVDMSNFPPNSLWEFGAVLIPYPEELPVLVPLPKGRQELLRTASAYGLLQLQQDAAECLVRLVNGEYLPAKCGAFTFSLEQGRASVQIIPGA